MRQGQMARQDGLGRADLADRADGAAGAAAADALTLQVYAEKARDYARLTEDSNPYLDLFLTGLSAPAQLLDLGCGPGHDAAAMAQAGHVVEAWDASAEFAALAQELHGISVRVATFHELDAVARYDGIWASFSLLHAPRADLPFLLGRMRRALRPGGRVHVAMKTGSGAARDALGRLYTYVSKAELRRLLQDAGLTVTFSETGADTGLDGQVAPWVAMQAHG